jgi:penicillin amidase
MRVHSDFPSAPACPPWHSALALTVAVRLALSATAAASLTGCGSCDDGPPPAEADGGMDAATDALPPLPPPPAPFEALPETGRFSIPELDAEAYVVRTEGNVPHVYARTRLDAMRVFGFTMARDRYFQMDLTRRLSQGTLTEVLGDVALETDIENRMTGGGFLADRFTAALTAEEAAEIDAFAEGINAYIEAVRARAARPPRELQLAFRLLGAASVTELMPRWTRRDVISTGVTVLYGTSFETVDVRRTAALARVDDAFEGMPDRELRLRGLREDVMNRVAPPNDVSSAAGWGIDTAGTIVARRRGPPPTRPLHLGGPRPEPGTLNRLNERLAHIVARMPRSSEGYGSNAWAVMGRATIDGSALLAGDGHLQLSVPALFWQVGLDTAHLGADVGEDLRMLGATIAGVPAIGVGTNGHVAWSQTAFFADVTDWYAERLVLGDDGLPRASIFEGEERPLTVTEETFVVRDVPALGSVGRTETIQRLTTFDGRWITSVEGRRVRADEPLGPGEARLNVMGDLIVPGDVDGDGAVSAVSFYYGPFDGGTVLRAFREFTRARTVEDYRQALRHFIGYGGAMTAADASGSVLHSAYHAVPCRNYLPRDEHGVWIDGADPRRLLDGTRYPSWRIPLDAEGRVDEAAAAAGGPRACAVPFDEWPQALDPARGFVMHANNDPGNIATDDDLFDDPYYIGGPWIEGYRAARIVERLSAEVATSSASLESMAALQADHHSNLGRAWSPYLLEAIEAARDAAARTPPPGSADARMAARFAAARADFEEVERRMRAWAEGGFRTPSGVETFYASVGPRDVADSVATTIHHAWLTSYVRGVLDDERIPGDLSPAVTVDTFRFGLMKLLVDGRGPGNPRRLGSYDPTREESVFFDDVRTPEIESSREVALRAIEEALAFLRSAPTAPGRGGYGTTDWDAWRWGLRHMVRFDSLVGSALGGDGSLDLLLNMFRITPATVPLATGLPAGDPRAMLPHFPRPGDHLEVDAANPGLDLDDWTYGSGPVFRMVIALGPSGVRGRNILPGGQSGFPGDPHFDDQARLWLGNQTYPLRFTPAEVAEGATGFERFVR